LQPGMRIAKSGEIFWAEREEKRKAESRKRGKFQADHGQETTISFVSIRSIRGSFFTTDGTDHTDFGSRPDENREVTSVTIRDIRG